MIRANPTLESISNSHISYIRHMPKLGHLHVVGWNRVRVVTWYPRRVRLYDALFQWCQQVITPKLVIRCGANVHILGTLPALPRRRREGR